MSNEDRNDDTPDYIKYAPKRLRDPAPSSSAERPTERQHVPSGPTVPVPSRGNQDRRTTSDFASWSEPVRPPRPPQWLETGKSTLIARPEPARPPPPPLGLEN